MIITVADHSQCYKELLVHQQKYIESTASVPSQMVILLTPEVDSLCAARMLTTQLKSDLIQFVMKPVQSYQELIDTTKQYLKDENIITIFMINCGGNINLSSYLTLESRVCIYILDSHRPYNLENVYHNQIKIFDDTDFGEDGMEREEKMAEVYPQLDDDNDSEDEDPESIRDEELVLGVGPGSGHVDGFSEDEDEDDDGEFFREDGSEGAGEDGSPSSKRRKRDPSAPKPLKNDPRLAVARQEETRARRERNQERRMRRAEYQSKKKRYYDFTRYGEVTSSLLLWGFLQQNNNSLWLSMIGSTDAFIHERVESSTWASITTELTNQVSRFNIKLSEQREKLEQKNRELGLQASDAVVTPVGHISDQDEFRCALMKHWNLYDALKYSPYVASRLQTWTETGHEAICQLLTSMGIKTADAQGAYKVMRTVDKMQVETQLEIIAEEDRGIQELTFKNFTRQLNPNLNISAADVVHALTALLELPPCGRDAKSMKVGDWKWEDGFWNAWKALEQNTSSNSSLDGYQLIQQGITQSIFIHKLIFDQATHLINTNALTTITTFRYVKLAETSDSIYLSHPLTLSKLGFFLFEYGAVVPPNVTKPIIICSPIPGKDAYLVVAVMGTMSVSGVQTRSPFGRRFRDAASPPLPPKEEEDERDFPDETEDERRQRLIETMAPDQEGNAGEQFGLLRVKQEQFDHCVVEVQKEDLELFLERI